MFTKDTVKNAILEAGVNAGYNIDDKITLYEMADVLGTALSCVLKSREFEEMIRRAIEDRQKQIRSGYGG